MQRIIQINIAGRVLPVEENAYQQLHDYISALEQLFASEPGNEEILNDIENRIAELFTIRMQSGAFSINKADVSKVIETLGMPSELNDAAASTTTQALPVVYELRKKEQARSRHSSRRRRRLFLNPDDKWLGGVCGGLGEYFDVDPVYIRIGWGALACIGIGILAYIFAWAVIPEAKTEADFEQMRGGDPMNLHTIAANVGSEMKGLQRRAEAMTRDLQDYFRRP